MAARMEAQWGDLRAYRGIATQGDGGLVCFALELGNVLIGVQVIRRYTRARARL